MSVFKRHLLFVTLFLTAFSANVAAYDLSQGEFSGSVVTTARASSVNQWLRAAGINPECEGFARDIFALMLGVRQPINDDLSLQISAGREFSVGVTF